MHAKVMRIAAPLSSGEKTAGTVMACLSSPLRGTKTGEQDWGLPLDLAQHRPLAVLLYRRVRLRRRDAQFWDHTGPQLRGAFRWDAMTVVVKRLEASLHFLQQGGASHARRCYALGLVDVQTREAWRGSGTLQVYERSSRAKELGK